MSKGQKLRHQEKLEKRGGDLKENSAFGLGRRGMNREMRKNKVKGTGKMNRTFIDLNKGCFGRSF